MDKKYFKKEIVSKEQIKDAVTKLAKEINEMYKGKSIVAMGLLKGVFVFISDIVRELDLDVEIEFLIVKSYQNGKTNGKPQIILDLKKTVVDKEIIIFEDIIDTGRTLKAVKEYLEYKGASNVKIATLLTKPSRREVHVDVDWSLFEIPNEIVVGYGLDYNEKFRQLPNILALSDEAIEEFKENN